LKPSQGPNSLGLELELDNKLEFNMTVNLTNNSIINLSTAISSSLYVDPDPLAGDEPVHHEHHVVPGGARTAVAGMFTVAWYVPAVPRTASILVTSRNSSRWFMEKWRTSAS
jgi:hypothetical protein